MKRFAMLFGFIVYLQLVPAFGNDVFMLAQNRELEPLKKAIEADKTAIKKIDDDGNTVLHHAMRWGRMDRDAADVVKYLVDAGVDVKAKNKEGKTVLHLAWCEIPADLEVIRLFVAKGCGVNDRDSKGWTPLHHMVSHTFSGVELPQVVAMGADVNATTTGPAFDDEPDSTNGTPLHITARRWDDRHIHRLLKLGAKVDARDNMGRTPLHWACVREDEDERALQDEYGAWAIKELLEAGADINAVDKKGNTPMHLAVGAGRADLVQVLFDKGADSEKANADGKKPADLAKGKGYPLTRTFGCETPEEFARGCQQNMKKIMTAVAAFNRWKKPDEMVMSLADKDVRFPGGKLCFEFKLRSGISETRCTFSSEGDLSLDGVVVCNHHGKYIVSEDDKREARRRIEERKNATPGGSGS